MANRRQGAGRKGGLQEARELVAIVSSLDHAGDSLDVSAIAGRLGISEQDARVLTGKLVNVQYTKSGATTVTPMCVERVDAAAKKITFRWMPDSSVTAEWTSANSAKIVPTGGGADGAPVYGTLVYGQNAFGDVELGGDGKNVKIIINPPGSAGADDPLEQRGTIAWKVRGFTCVILQDAFMVRIEHGATA